MQDVPFVSTDERATYARYDQERRLRLSRVIAPAVAMILGLVLLASVLAPTHFTGTRSHFALVLFCWLLFTLGAGAAWRGRVNVATGSILGGALLLVVLSVVVNQPFILSDLFTVPAVVIIGLSALIGLPWMILATAACTSGFVLLLAGSPSLAKDLADPNNVNSVGAFIAEQWVLALVVYGAARGYRRVLHQISDVSVQYGRARRLDQLKDQFITSVNHELRNPVMVMQGYIELLRLKGHELPPEHRAALIQRASRAGDNLVELLESILDVRRLDQQARSFSPEAVPLFEAVGAATSLLDPREGQEVERELRVRMPSGLLVWGERMRVQQILTNLLSNAIKYSPPGTPVEVDVAMVSETTSPPSRWPPRARAERRMVEITVRDYGLGIPPDEAPLLFQRFVRLPRDLASTVPGNGLGLYICRELAEAMGGSIRVESAGTAGAGSTFYVRLPAPPETACGAPSPSRKEATPREAGAVDTGGPQ
jgi:signal transduction histidine kinase